MKLRNMPIARWAGDARLFCSLPCLRVDLMYARVRRIDAYYATVTEAFYREAVSRHRRFPLVRAFTHGVALCELQGAPGDYLKRIEPSGRRNIRKAQRLGYIFKKIDYNAYRSDIGEIWRSTDTRQGKISEAFLNAEVVPCPNPPPRTATHDYPYFGVLKDDHLAAYAGILIAGELAMIEHIYGHAVHQKDGVVPLLLDGMADYLREHYPAVRYYGYGSYFGAAVTLRRFKKKFGFMPYRVKWLLGEKGDVERGRGRKRKAES
jgi:hypothetical protein